MNAQLKYNKKKCSQNYYAKLYNFSHFVFDYFLPFKILKLLSLQNSAPLLFSLKRSSENYMVLVSSLQTPSPNTTATKILLEEDKVIQHYS